MVGENEGERAAPLEPGETEEIDKGGTVNQYWYRSEQLVDGPRALDDNYKNESAVYGEVPTVGLLRSRDGAGNQAGDGAQDGGGRNRRGSLLGGATRHVIRASVA